jgi:bifunctional NMN adenylyltransferase/nudix hydrolase
MYDDDKWIAKVQATVAGVCENYGANPNSIVLVGHKKDSSSFYLDLFKQWSYHEVVPSRKLDATKIRSYLFAKDLVADDSAVPFLREMVPASIMGNIDFWSNTDDYRNLVEEYANIQKYKAAWASAPYQPTFVTTDAIVTCAGHVLMIRRKFAPGKGLLALPGGFLNPGERIIQGILRELKEETQINVGRGMLESMIREIRVFDHPDRSLRGRTITHTAHIPLNFKVLPEVKGDDDADGAMWVPFYDLALNRDQIFEDHGDQISSMTGVDL